MKIMIFFSVTSLAFSASITLIRRSVGPEHTGQLFCTEYFIVINPAFFISEILTGKFFKNDANSF